MHIRKSIVVRDLINVKNAENLFMSLKTYSPPENLYKTEGLQMHGMWQSLQPVLKPYCTPENSVHAGGILDLPTDVEVLCKA